MRPFRAATPPRSGCLAGRSALHGDSCAPAVLYLVRRAGAVEGGDGGGPRRGIDADAAELKEAASKVRARERSVRPCEGARATRRVARCGCGRGRCIGITAAF
eukprot:3174080-Prymnesium_polylepis.1